MKKYWRNNRGRRRDALYMYMYIFAKRDSTEIREMTAARCAPHRFIPTRRSRATPRRRASEINSRTCAWHDPGRLLARRPQSNAGKCNAPGCTKVTKCHLLKATRCASLQASSRRPVCNYMFLFSFLLSSLFFSSFIISRPPARIYVRLKTSVRPAELRPRNRYLSSQFSDVQMRAFEGTFDIPSRRRVVNNSSQENSNEQAVNSERIRIGRAYEKSQYRVSKRVDHKS